MNKQTRKAYALLRKRRHSLSRQQIRTLKGQIKAGDAEGAMRGIKRITKEGQYTVLHKISPVYPLPDVRLKIVRVIRDTPKEITAIVEFVDKEEQNEQADNG